ncbi:MAG: hypothetical protein GY795_45300 [Desulfobacterales bacterium]|nr:hypothetical protein [Desulfobacterales bacterium]
MYLAPLNYDRFFRKVFSDPEISGKFLEDFLDTKIESIEILKEKHAVTDDAAFVEFDFRCRIKDAYVVIDMQQWYKADVSQRFYLYHALNTGLQLENLPKRKIILDGPAKQIRKVKDYRSLEPVCTLIWMVDDTLKFDSDFAAYRMTPEIVTDFVTNEKLWNKPEIVRIMKQRADALKAMLNKTKSLDFLQANRLVFAFQKNIVKNRKIGKYSKWFEFAEKTRNTDNKPEDFEGFAGAEPFDEMMRRLNRTALDDDDLAYIEREKEAWEEVQRFVSEYYEEGKETGRYEGIRDTVRKLISSGKLNTDEIAEITGLSTEEVQSMQVKP